MTQTVKTIDPMAHHREWLAEFHWDEMVRKAKEERLRKHVVNFDQIKNKLEVKHEQRH
ncbi:hypothetical protein OfM1_19190 [Lactovum odontotermitis]